MGRGGGETYFFENLLARRQGHAPGKGRYRRPDAGSLPYLPVSVSPSCREDWGCSLTL